MSYPSNTERIIDALENLCASVDKLAEILGHNSTGRGGPSDKRVEKGSIPLCPTKTWTCTDCSKEVLDTIDSCPDCFISDGFDSVWSIWCPMCYNKSMQVVRPGKVQCEECG